MGLTSKQAGELAPRRLLPEDLGLKKPGDSKDLRGLSFKLGLFLPNRGQALSFAAATPGTP